MVYYILKFKFRGLKFMKKIIVNLILIMILFGTLFFFTGCTLKIETTEN